jgi:rhomboid protease GluP
MSYSSRGSGGSFVLTGEVIKRSYLTLIILALNILAFIGVNLIWGGAGLAATALNGELVYSEGQWWRLLTACFIHWDLMHLFSNMFGLLVLGSFIEQNFSKMQFFLIYFVSGLTGNLFSLWIYPLYIYSAGASGAIYGLMGAAFVLNVHRNRNLLLYSFIYLGISIYNSFAPGVGTWAHLFGLGSGLAMGYLFFKIKMRNMLSISTQKRYFR